MEFTIGLLGAIVAVVIPIYLQRMEHPRRQLRYSLVSTVENSPANSEVIFRLLAWSAGRADIPSGLFDSGRNIIFHFDAPVAVVETATAPVKLGPHFELTGPTELLIAAQLLHHDFSAEITLSARVLPRVLVDNPLIDVRITRDMRVEKSPAPARQDRAVARSRARARVSLMLISVWLTVVSAVMVIAGSLITTVNNSVGTGIAIPALLVFPVAVIMLIVAALRKFIAYLRRRRNPENTVRPHGLS
jgi:uncharacterized membrane protein